MLEKAMQLLLGAYIFLLVGLPAVLFIMGIFDRF
jgi:hypothetical protein